MKYYDPGPNRVIWRMSADLSVRGGAQIPLGKYSGDLMRKPVGFLTTVVPALVSLIISTGSARAAPVTYTEEATATGRLGGVNFTNANVLFTMINDTTNVTAGPSTGLFINIGTVKVSINSGSPVTFLGLPRVFVNQVTAAVGIKGGAGGIPDILDVQNAAFATYDLTTSIGPVSGAAAFNPGFVFFTSGGPFVLNDIAGDATFTAIVSSAVPQPSSLTLLVIALAGLGVMRRRRAA